MKKLYYLEWDKSIQPKKETIQAILNFSKSIEVMEVKNKKFIISKN